MTEGCHKGANTAGFHSRAVCREVKLPEIRSGVEAGGGGGGNCPSMGIKFQLHAMTVLCDAVLIADDPALYP